MPTVAASTVTNSISQPGIGVKENWSEILRRNLDLVLQDRWKYDIMGSQFFKQESVVTPPRLINGHDLITNFNLSPGPEIGKLLETICEARACHEVSTKDEALAYASRLLSLKKGD